MKEGQETLGGIAEQASKLSEVGLKTLAQTGTQLQDQLMAHQLKLLEHEDARPSAAPAADSTN